MICAVWSVYLRLGIQGQSSGIQRVCKQEPFAFDVLNSEHYSLILTLLLVITTHFLLWLFYVRQDGPSVYHPCPSAEIASL